jgi:hypothetical protein
MAITAKITVVQRQQSAIVRVLILTAFWIILVGAISISRIWLGGSFLVEAIAAVFSIIVLVGMAKHNSGVEVSMTPEELRRWLNEGAPADVIEWRASNGAKVVS